MTLSEFEAVLEQKDALVQKKSQKFDILNNFYKGLDKNKKKKAPRHPVFERIKDIAQKFHDFWDNRISQYHSVIHLAALTLEIPKTEDFIEWKTISAGNYHTQGFGACAYARNAAMEYVDKAVFYGLEAEIEEINKQTVGQHCIQYADYVVKVKTTKTGLEILEEKPELDIVEKVRLCWKRGVNPRVYWYWLPEDFEAKNGLDYFGNYVDNQK